MARTVNRQPVTVDVNIGKDTSKIFMQSNWKGLCTNKNIPNLDQETFEDCKNVYINVDGVLSSRPSFKLAKAWDLQTEKIIKMWKFADVKVYMYQKLGSYFLRFVEKNYQDIVVASATEPSLFLFDEKIIILTGTDIRYYKQGAVNDAKDYIYKPIKYLITNNVKEEYETDNVLINAYRERYIYTGVDNITNPPYLGKTVTIKYNDYSETKVFDDNSKHTIFLPKFSVSNENYLQVSSKDNMISYDKFDDGSYNIYYSPNGKVFSLLSSVTDIYGEPVISKDGKFVVVFKNDGPYALSLLEDSLTGIKTFQDWTNLLTYNNVDKTKFAELGNYITGFHNCVGGTFINEKTFAYAYGIEHSIVNDDLIFNKVQYVKVNNNVNESDSVRFDYYDVSSNTNVTDNAKNKKIYTDYDGSNIYFVTKLNNKGAYVWVDNNSNWSSYYRYANDIYDIKASTEDTKLSSGYGYLLLGNFTNQTDDGTEYQATFVYYKLKNRDYYKEIPGTSGKILYNYDILTDKSYYSYNNHNVIDLTNSSIDYVVKSYGHTYYINDNIVYSNYIGDDIVTVDVEYGDSTVNFNYKYYCKLNEHYFAKDNNLYISLYKENDDDEQLLYLPKLNVQKFDEAITNIHPISETQIAIFFKDEIWHTDLTENGEYLYYKSKLQTGILPGSDVITSVDGKNIIFSSTRGLVYMSYQELVQSTEQTLTYLSDVISEVYDEYNKKPIKLYIHKYWIYCYNNVDKVFYIFDMRNNSWWKWEYNKPILNILSIENDLCFLVNYDSNNYRKLVYDNNYKDNENQISWYFKSQKLHFNTLNNYKNVHSIIINNLEGENNSEATCNLSITNYRISTSDRYVEPQNLEYKVNTIRTFVKRCNSRKLNEFQYTISSDTGDNGSAIQHPINIHSIMIKYSISGQVR